MPPLTKLRPVTALDTELIASMHTISWQHSYRTMLPDSYLDKDIEEERLHYWREKMTKHSDRSVTHIQWITKIAENEKGEAIGFFSGEWDPACPHGALLDNIHILPQHQGGGAGREMMRCFKEWAKESGASQIHLFVLEQNTKAIQFYERNGWDLAESFETNLAGADVSSRRYVYHF